MSTIKLKSSDGEVFLTEVEVANFSGTIRRLLEDVKSDNMEDVEIPLANVNSSILKRILDWSEHERDNQSSSIQSINRWDDKFLDVDQGTLFEIILAANYLDTKRLLEAACKTVANMIKGKTPAEIRTTFNVMDDLKPEEEEQARKENEPTK